MNDIYQDGQYLTKTKTWHAEDSKWKSEQIARLLQQITEPIQSFAEIGCGAGEILTSLADHPLLSGASAMGFDVSPQAIDLCKRQQRDDIEFHCVDPLDSDDNRRFDLLLAIDVFEHVPDYMGFLSKCCQKARFKIYHIPLDLHVSSILRDRLIVARQDVGHLHYFSASTALSTLRDTGHEIIDYRYTRGGIELFSKHPSLKRAFANVPRWLTGKFSTSVSAKLFGGYSLLVLAK